MTGFLVRRGDENRDRCTGRLLEDIERRQLICKPRRETTEETTLPTLWSWTSTLQNCVEINFYCVTQTVCSTYLWLPTILIPGLKWLLWGRMGESRKTEVYYLCKGILFLFEGVGHKGECSWEQRFQILVNNVIDCWLSMIYLWSVGLPTDP